MLLPHFALPEQSLYARKIFSRGTQFGDRLRLARGKLKAEPEDLFGKFVLPGAQFGRILISQSFNSPRH
jgi:hypothetical protein